MPRFRKRLLLEILPLIWMLLNCETQSSSIHWLSSPIFPFGCLFDISTYHHFTIWCFRPQKPHIFYIVKNMILAMCQHHHIIIRWSSYHHGRKDPTYMLLKRRRLKDIKYGTLVCHWCWCWCWCWCKKTRKLTNPIIWHMCVNCFLIYL